MKGKKALTVLALATILYLAGCVQQESAPKATPTPASGGVAQVEMKGFSFTPAELRVTAGTTVVWLNSDPSPHTIVYDSGDAQPSGTIEQGRTYKRTFTAAGTYGYHCGIHPSMKAKIIVE